MNNAFNKNNLTNNISQRIKIKKYHCHYFTISKKNKIIFFMNFLIFFWINSKYYLSSVEQNSFKIEFKKEISKIFKSFNKVNINEIDEKINGKKFYNTTKINSTINVGFTLDKNFILETMITVSSILATQYKTTKIRFHFGVTNNFKINKMIKLYGLRNKINNLSEFNFYYLKESVIKMKNFHSSGEACPGKFELPKYLPDDIERLIIFDAGDLLVLRDLTKLYNYEMGHYWVLGTLEPTIINSFMKNSYNMTKYLNIGSILLNIKKLKEKNFWSIYTKSRYLKIIGQPDQTLFNILIPDNKKNYLPFKFGGYTLFRSDQDYERKNFEDFKFKEWFHSNLSKSLDENPKSEEGIILNLYNSLFIHQFYGKWKYGQGLSIYRHLAKYFILISGVSKEICKKSPGYCI